MPPPYPLIFDIVLGRCLPFVGAGFSKNASLPTGYSMPDWSELTAILARDAATIRDSPPTVVAQRYEQRFGRVQLIETIRESLHPGKARPGKAHRAFAHLPFDTIYTTNFDLLLEDAYPELSRPFRSLVGELQIPFHAGPLASSIVKIHGDMRHEEYLIVTKNDYDTFLDKHPVVATHLSSMLITRTPLFLGYSLSDPDFQNIRKVVRSRLGAFERMAYIVQFDTPPERIEEGFENKLHIISLDTSSGKTYDDVLAEFFEEIQREIDAKSGADFRNSRPDLFEQVEPERVQEAINRPEQSAVIETTSRLCFVMMPFGGKTDEIYRLVIAPASLENGLTVLRADEISAPGFIMEQIRTAIQQSRLCIADVTGSNPNVMYEIGYAQAVGKPVVMLSESGANLPFDVAHQRAIMYSNDTDVARSELSRAIFIALSEGRLGEAARLFDLGEYRGAIAASAVVLEQTFRRVIGTRSPKGLPMSLGSLSKLARKRLSLRPDLAARLNEIIKLRNHAVHDFDEPTRDQAQLVLSATREILELLPSRHA